MEAPDDQCGSIMIIDDLPQIWCRFPASSTGKCGRWKKGAAKKEGPIRGTLGLGGCWEPNVYGAQFNPMLGDEELQQWRLLLEALTPYQRRSLLLAVFKMVKIEDEGHVTPIRPQSGRA